MDFLGGYDDSDASSSDDENGNEKILAPAPTTSTASSTVKSILKKSSLSTSTGTGTGISKKGKRRLRLNLNAVLPPDILKRLTKSTVQGGGEGSSSSSSDSDDEDDSDNDNNNAEESGNEGNGVKRKRKNRARDKNKPSKSTIASNSSEDVGINSLLTDLNGFMPTGKKKVKPTLTGGTSRTAGIGKNTVTATKISADSDAKVHDMKVEKEEPLGMAFMKVSTTIVRKKRNGNSRKRRVDDGDGAVVDIHGQGTNIHATSTSTASQSLDNREKVQVENVDSDSDSDGSASDGAGTAVGGLVEDKAAQPLFPGIEEGAERDNKISASDANDSVRGRLRVPRPAAPGISVGRKRSMAGFGSTNAAPGMSSISNSSAGAHNMAQYQQKDQPQESKANITSTSTTQQPNRKRSKREMERALRAGNFDSMDFDHQMDSVNYDQHNQVTGTSSGMEGSGSGGFHTGGLEHYAPSAGTTVKGLSGKMKGKHQIHSLVQSAAKLEADQRRMGAMGGTAGGVGGKSRRADAKKKYGW